MLEGLAYIRDELGGRVGAEARGRKSEGVQAEDSRSSFQEEEDSRKKALTGTSRVSSGGVCHGSKNPCTLASE